MKLISLICCFFLITSLLAQDGIWQKLNEPIPLPAEYDNIVELCGKHFMIIDHRLYKSEDEGANWHFIEDASGSVLLRDNGIIMLSITVENSSPTAYVGYYTLYAYDCESDAFQEQNQFDYAAVFHSCNEFATISYQLGQFTTKAYGTCHLAGFSSCFNYISEDGMAWDLDDETNYVDPSASGTSCSDPANLVATRTGIVQGEEIDEYYFVTIGSDEQLDLGEIAAVYLNDTIYYVGMGDSIHYKNSGDAAFMSVLPNLGMIKDLGAIGGDLYLATESSIYKTSGTVNDFNFQPLISSVQLGGLLIEEVYFLGATFLVKTQNGQTLRFDSEGQQLDIPQIYAPSGFSDLTGNSKEIFVENQYLDSWFGLENNMSTTLEEITDPFVSQEHPVWQKTYEDLTLLLTKVDFNYTLIATIDHNSFDTLRSFAGGSEIKIDRLGDMITINDIRKEKIYYSLSAGVTWNEAELPIYYCLVNRPEEWRNRSFHIDANGNWLVLDDDYHAVYSTDYGDSWIAIPTGASEFHHAEKIGSEVFFVSNQSYNGPIDIYLWNPNTFDLELTHHYVNQDSSRVMWGPKLLTDDYGVLQMENGKIILYSDQSDSLFVHQPPFQFEHRYHYLDCSPDWFSEYDFAGSALDYQVLGDRIFAHSTEGIWYANLCDILIPENSIIDTVLVPLNSIWNGVTMTSDSLFLETVDLPNINGCDRVIQTQVIVDESQGIVFNQHEMISDMPTINISGLSNLQNDLPQNQASEADFYHDQNSINFILFPNPTSGQLTIEIPGKKDYSEVNIRIYNALGKLIDNVQTNEKRMSLSLEGIASGVYFIQIIDGNKKGIQRFVKR